eukprot:3864026-Amphidinium_carterae.1
MTVGLVWLVTCTFMAHDCALAAEPLHAFAFFCMRWLIALGALAMLARLAVAVGWLQLLLGSTTCEGLALLAIGPAGLTVLPAFDHSAFEPSLSLRSLACLGSLQMNAFLHMCFKTNGDSLKGWRCLPWTCSTLEPHRCLEPLRDLDSGQIARRTMGALRLALDVCNFRSPVCGCGLMGSLLSALDYGVSGSLQHVACSFRDAQLSCSLHVASQGGC